MKVRARAHPVGRLFDDGGEVVDRHIADIAVLFELHPGPALGDVVDGAKLAEQSFGEQWGVEAGHDPHGRGGADYLAQLALHVAGGLDPVLQRGGGQVLPVDVPARIEFGCVHAFGNIPLK